MEWFILASEARWPPNFTTTHSNSELYLGSFKFLPVVATHWMRLPGFFCYFVAAEEGWQRKTRLSVATFQTRAHGIPPRFAQGKFERGISRLPLLHVYSRVQCETLVSRGRLRSEGCSGNMKSKTIRVERWSQAKGQVHMRWRMDCARWQISRTPLKQKH